MNTEKIIKRIALIGGGPGALYICKHFIDSKRTDIELSVFEKTDSLGAGMPYSAAGANTEHIANISANEIPELITPMQEWIHTVPLNILQTFDIDPLHFNEYKVLPRLLVGYYLSAQFRLLIDTGESMGIKIHVRLNHNVTDIQDKPETDTVCIESAEIGSEEFDACIICTGHFWPKTYEDNIQGYYDSPYPPSKLTYKMNHAVAIRGTSLTAIDAIRTLSRTHGHFKESNNGMLTYTISDDNPSFQMVLFSTSGMLPAIRIHTEEAQPSTHDLLTPEVVETNRAENNGFLSLNFVFEFAFKNPLKEKDPQFYACIQDMNMEAFVTYMMNQREQRDPFLLFEAEYKEAETSIQRKQPIYWKEMLAALSFTLNYPAKYFSAEDMKRLHDTLGELISIVIAFVPQGSAREILALHAANVLNIIKVDKNSHIEPQENGGIIYQYKTENDESVASFYNTFIDAIGQKDLPMEKFPFKTLRKENTISQACLAFKDTKAAEQEIKKGNKNVHKKTDATYFMDVPGLAINDSFQVINDSGIANERIYIMAVPFISGYNPDYSGLDFCNKASHLISEHVLAAKTYNE